MTDSTLSHRGDAGGSHWVSRTVAVMFGLGLLATLGVVFTRIVAIRVPEQRATLEKLIAERTGLDVRFENVRFSWGLDGTGAVFTRVVLTDPKAGRIRVVAPELRVELDAWDLLRHRQFSLGHVTLASPDIEIIADARVVTAKADASAGARTLDTQPALDEAALIRSYLSWAELMPAGRIEVEGARVHLKQRGASGMIDGAASHSFTLSEAVISRGNSSFNAHGTMLLSQDVGQSLFVSAKLDGLAAGSNVSGDLRVIARRVFLERLPTTGLSGRGTIDARLQLHDGLLESGSWQASARDLQLNGEDGTRFDHVTVRGRLSRAGHDLLLDFEDLQLTRGARLERAPALSARLQFDSNLNNTRTSMQAERLPFMASEFLAGVFAPRVDAVFPAAPSNWTPTSGEFQDVNFDSGAGWDDWKFSARMTEGAVTRAADQALIAQLQGSVRADARGVSLIFDSAGKSQVKAPGAPEPVTVSLSGELALLADPNAPRWRFASFTASQGSGAVTADGAWGASTARVEPLRVTLNGVDRATLLDAWTLFAAGAASPEIFAEVQRGRIVEGRLALMPAADGTVNWDRSSGKMTLADLATGESAAPRVAGGRGSLNFARGAAQLKLDAADVEDLALRGAQLDWPRRGTPRLRVALEGDLASPLIRDVLQAQGLDRIGGSVVLDAEARGERELRQPQLWRVTARVRGAKVPLGDGLPVAENLAGTIRYAGRQLRGLELKGNWLGGPVEIESRRAGTRGSLSYVMHGVADAAPLLELSGKADASRQVNGQLAWSGTAEPGDEAGSWQITLSSNLAGVESGLPEPFDKPRARSMPVTAKIYLATDGVREFNVAAEDLSIRGQVHTGLTTARFTVRGVTGEMRREARDPDRPELQIDVLDLKRAPSVLAAAGALLPADTALFVNVDELRYRGNNLGALHAAIDRQQAGLAFSVDSAANAPHQLSAHGRCNGNGRCDAEFSAATTQLTALLRDVSLPEEWPTASLQAAGSLHWPADPGADVVRSLTGSFDLATEGEREHQLTARATIADGQILLADVQGTGPAPDQVFRGTGRVGLFARDYDLSVEYERVTLAAAAVPTPARARLARAWSAVRGSAAKRGWTEAPDTRRIQWHGTWD